MARKLIINMGLPKTGNISLVAAMRKLGFRSWHGGNANSSTDDVRPLFDGVRPPWDFFCDHWMLRSKAHVVAHHFPAVYVICTVRNFDAWEHSVIMHRKAARDGRPGIAQTEWSMALESRNQLLERFAKNIENAIRVIKTGCKFLSLDVDDEYKWERLCDFLEVPQQEWVYPRKNMGWWRTT